MIAGARQLGRAARSPFVHLHIHSNYTLMSGASRVEEIVQAAARLGFDAVALTDTNALHGAVPFYQACEAADLKAIIGAEIEVGDVRAVLLARDLEGYRALCRIVTARQLDDDFPMQHNPAANRNGQPAQRAIFCSHGRQPVEAGRFPRHEPPQGATCDDEAMHMSPPAGACGFCHARYPRADARGY